MRQLGHDVLALTELQYELLQVELREFAGKVVAPALILAAGAMALGVGATPIALLALGYVLADAFEISLPSALLIAAGGGLIAASAIGLLAWRRITATAGTFVRSRQELSRNLEWLRSVLDRRGCASDKIDQAAGVRPRPR